MQNPCLTFRPPHPRQLAVQVAWVLGLMGAQALPGPSEARATTSPVETGSLLTQVGQWVAARQGVRLQQVEIQAPDPRVRVPACATGFQLDAPFGHSQMVRARCEQPAWQIYLRTRWDGMADPGDPSSERNARGERTPAQAQAQTQATLTPTQPPGATSPAQAPPPNATRRVPVLSRATPRGALLGPAAVEWAMVPAREVDNLVLTDPSQLQQAEAVRDLPAGQPVRSTDIRPAVLVRLGQMVQLTVGQGTGFTVSVRLEALQDGRMGDRISLRNPESGRTVSGVVTGPNQAQGG